MFDEYFKTYPGIKTFLDQTVADAKEKGYCVSLFGRRRPVPELKSSNFMQRSFGERIAMNSPIQGTAADIIKIAMIHVNRKLKELNLKSRLILQIHDELLIEAHESEIDTVKKLLKEKMEIGRASLYGWHKQTLWSRDRHRFHLRENGRVWPSMTCWTKPA